MEVNGDVPRNLKMGNKTIPLDRYLLHKLRKEVGFTDEYISEVKSSTSKEVHLELLALLDASLADLESEAFVSPSTIYRREVKQRILNLEAQWKIKGKKRNTL